MYLFPSGAVVYVPFGIFRVQRRCQFLDNPLLFFEYLMDLGEPRVAADKTKSKNLKAQAKAAS